MKELDPSIFTKSGIMVGLGEERNEILQLMDDLRSANVDFMTIGQYLQPSKKHHPVEALRDAGGVQVLRDDRQTKGFLLVASSPLTRSSHHAGEDFARLRAAREAHAREIGVAAGYMPKHSKQPAPRRTPAGEDVRAGRGCREVSRIPAALRGADACVSRKERDGWAILVADMTVGYKAIRETFTSQVHLKPAELTIDVKYLDGPFRYLTNIWSFEPAGQRRLDDPLLHRL